jgi:citronellol/citronellal dehydrogenase
VSRLTANSAAIGELAGSASSVDAYPLRPAYGSAVVTGGGSGLGRGVTLALARVGVEVTILGRHEDTLHQTQAESQDFPGRVHVLTCDIRDPLQVQAVFDEVCARRPVQMLYQAASSLHHALAVDITPEDFIALIQGSLVGPFHVIRAWALALIRAGLPGVAAVVSSAKGGRETPGIAHSSAAKNGLEAFVRTVAREWGGYGLRLNCIGPGPIETEGMAATFDDATTRGRLTTMTALGRLGRLEEIVGPSMFLLSDAASFMTGEVIVVDGGMRLTPWQIVAPADERAHQPPGTWTHRQYSQPVSRASTGKEDSSDDR